jgi:hypothetical protein
MIGYFKLDIVNYMYVAKFYESSQIKGFGHPRKIAILAKAAFW